jgi:hypothetical protein
VERARFELATSGLQSRASDDDERRRSTLIAHNHAPFEAITGGQAASL